MTTTNQLPGATGYLILHHPFIAVPLLRLRLVPDPDQATAATDGRAIYFNEDFVSNLTFEETIFLLAHEVLHVALGHHLRRGERDLKAWNAAADFVINLLLLEAGFQLISGTLYDPWYAGWSTEQVYRAIVEQAQEALDIASQANANGTGSPVPSLDDFVPEGTGGLVVDIKGDDGQDLSQAEVSREEGELSVTLKHALRMDAMIRGESLGAAFSRAVQPRSPAFDPRAELAAFLTATVGRDDYSWSRPNLRYLAGGVYLPSLARGLALVDVVVAIDTSASITPRLLSFMAGACEDILAAYPQSVLQVVYCDSAVRSTEEITLYDCPVTLSKAQGGRGTRFTPVFDWVEEKGYHPTFLLYMTDLEGDSPSDPGYPVVWLAIDARHSSPPFGHRIDISSVE
jgi:predicted metal-dependent peptidase